jgi:curved DNA-binding protein CbpA
VEDDPYRILQVDPGADQEVIEAAYRRLARKYHPDVNANVREAELRMKQLNRAHDLLRDPIRRAEYDRTRRAALDKPELAILPAEVVLKQVDPGADSVTFMVRIQQVAGPPFDPGRHRLRLLLRPPWDRANVHWRWTRNSLPADVEFTLDVSQMRLVPGQRLSGDIELQISGEG